MSEWVEKDYYDVLGVSETATPEEITKAYRRLARRLHPDANPGDKGAEERFKEVSAAYEVIGDSARRAEYDEARRLVTSGAASGGGPFRVHVTNADDLGDFGFGDLFDGFFTSAATWGRPAGAGRRGSDLEAELHLRFEDAVFGVATEVHVQGPVGRMRDVKVRVPAGVEDGQVIRIPGRGDPGTNGGPAGDLYVLVRVADHDLFTRRGSDLTVTVPVTYPEAVLGAEVKVPTLDGPPVTVKVPAGTPSGRVLRVRGRGVPGPRGRGDLLVTIEVAVPPEVQGQERKAVEDLAQAISWSPRERLGV